MYYFERQLMYPRTHSFVPIFLARYCLVPDVATSRAANLEEHILLRKLASFEVFRV